MAKAKKYKSPLPSNDWSTRELRAFIRENTAKLNQHYKDIEAAGLDLKEDFPAQYEMKNRLIEVSGVKSKGGMVGLGLTYKLKPELVYQARLIQQALELDRPRIEANEMEDRMKKAYDTFKQNHVTDMSYEEYKDFVEAMGALHEHIATNFSYEDFMELATSSFEQGQKPENFIKDVLQAVRDGKGAGLTTDDLLMMVKENMKGPGEGYVTSRKHIKTLLRGR